MTHYGGISQHLGLSEDWAPSTPLVHHHFCPIELGIWGHTVFSNKPIWALKNSSQHGLCLHLLQKTWHLNPEQPSNVVSRLRLLKFDDKPAQRQLSYVKKSLWQYNSVQLHFLATWFHHVSSHVGHFFLMFLFKVQPPFVSRLSRNWGQEWTQLPALQNLRRRRITYVDLKFMMYTYHTLHYIRLHYMTLHYMTWHDITLRYVTLHTYICDISYDNHIEK